MFTVLALGIVPWLKVLCVGRIQTRLGLRGANISRADRFVHWTIPSGVALDKSFKLGDFRNDSVKQRDRCDQFVA